MQYFRQRLIVTGGTGFLGSYFIRHALEKGHAIHALKRPSCSKIPEGTERALWFEASLKEPRLQSSWEARTLVHFAAHGVDAARANWADCFRVNVTESLICWASAAAAGVSRFIICGSCFEYGKRGEHYEYIPIDAPLEPTGPYAASKAAATMAAIAFGHDYKVEVAILRPAHVFGLGEGSGKFWPALREAALSGKDFPMTKGEQVRDFVPVEVAAERFLQIANDPTRYTPPRLLNIGSGNPQTLREFAEHWWKGWNASGKLLIGAIPYRKNEVMRYVLQDTGSLPSEDCNA